LAREKPHDDLCGPSRDSSGVIFFGMATEEQGGSKIGYWILTVILVVIAVYVYFRK